MSATVQNLGNSWKITLPDSVDDGAIYIKPRTDHAAPEGGIVITTSGSGGNMTTTEVFITSEELSTAAAMVEKLTGETPTIEITIGNGPR